MESIALVCDFQTALRVVVKKLKFEFRWRQPVFYVNKMGNIFMRADFFIAVRSVPLRRFTVAMALASPQGLRQRLSDSANHVDGIHVIDDRDEKPRPNVARDEVVWGKTPSGEGTCQQ